MKFSTDLYDMAVGETVNAYSSGIFASRPTLKVLVYTDSIRENFGTNSFGFGTMIRLIAENTPFYVNIKLTNINRHEGGLSGTRKLTSESVNIFQYDEIWFFCRGQRNVPNLANPLLTPRWVTKNWYDGNFPDSELDDEEVELLWTYMSSGGVLIAGDHANPDPLNPDGPNDTYLNLGRAVGWRIPRAGRLRRWIGPPTIDGTNYDTLVKPPFTDAFDVEY